MFVVGLRIAPAVVLASGGDSVAAGFEKGSRARCRSQMAIRRSGRWCWKITGTPVPAPSRRYAKLVSADIDGLGGRTRVCIAHNHSPSPPACLR